MRISDWSSDVCSSDLPERQGHQGSGQDGRDRHGDGEPEGGNQHRSLHPPAQRHGEAFGVQHGRSLPPPLPSRAGRVATMAVNSVRIPLVRLDRDLPVPSYAPHDDAGADLMTTVDVTLAPGERRLVPTGVAL